MLRAPGWGPVVLSALAIGIIRLLLVWLRRAERAGEALGIAMVMGGAIGT